MASTPVTAQAPVFTAATIGCARFVESLRGELESRYGAVSRTETLGRDGILVMRASQDSAGLRVESWYERLAVFREGPEGRVAPGTEGILGGRYVGLLDPEGDYLAEVTPYVPVALREVFDFGRILLQFFPPLSPLPLAPGGEWTDDAGLTIWRLADSAAAAGPIRRYRWIRRDAWDEGVGAGDSTLVVHRSETEDGRLRWREGTGPLGWDRSTDASVEFADGSGRSRLTQHTQVRREGGDCR